MDVYGLAAIPADCGKGGKQSRDYWVKSHRKRRNFASLGDGARGGCPKALKTLTLKSACVPSSALLCPSPPPIADQNALVSKRLGGTT